MSSETRLRPVGLTRRGLLGGLAGGLLLPRLASAAPAPAGPVVALEYGIASTMLKFGTVPAAVASLDGWQKWVVEPAMPPEVVDLGSAWEVNLEILAGMKPELILTTPFLAFLTPKLEPIAPIVSIDVYGTGGDALERAITETVKLGDILGRQQQATALLAEAEALFDDCAARIRKLRPGPIAVVSFTDRRHARIHGRPGLYHSVMQRIGIENAWTAETNMWGFQTIGIEELGRLQAERTRLVVMEPLPPDVPTALERSTLWQSLPFVRQKRVSTMPAVLLFGMVEEARRFARLLTEHLEKLA
ncbi:iron-siderophore ABC transporter substrate-binding protein [Rhizobium sp. LjRoot30]|uniref:iron-siderophore ABC transporter substrate-binding protein n=1 Tax=Rhizobium sp. LjRoot30 TaxID=3342320 RepID=UPI003ECE8A9E